MQRRTFLAMAFAVAISSGTAHAEPPAFKVIVNAENPITSISKSTLAAMLLKSTTTWASGAKVLPVDQRVGSRAREAVSRAVHGRSATAIKNWWNQQIFAGKGVPPPELPSDARVVAYVTANSGAIGYVAGDASTGDAKTISVTE